MIFIFCVAGIIESGNLTETGQLNHFFHQTCTWLLDSHVERQLIIQLASNQNRQYLPHIKNFTRYLIVYLISLVRFFRRSKRFDGWST